LRRHRVKTAVPRFRIDRKLRRESVKCREIWALTLAIGAKDHVSVLARAVEECRNDQAGGRPGAADRSLVPACRCAKRRPSGVRQSIPRADMRPGRTKGENRGHAWRHSRFGQFQKAGG
jgi:hypothetical protein